MVNLALVAPGVLSAEEGREMYGVLAAAIAPGRLPRVRCAVLGTLWTSAAGSGDPQALWRQAAIQEELLACTGGEEPEEVRANALGTLWAMSVGGWEQQQRLWEHEAVRQAFLDGVSVQQPAPVRTNALLGMRGLAAAPAVSGAMWREEALGDAILDSAGEDQPSAVREAALELLAQFAMSEENWLPMLDAEVHLVFEEAMEDAGVSGRVRQLCSFRRECLVEAEAWREPAEGEEEGVKEQEQQ